MEKNGSFDFDTEFNVRQKDLGFEDLGKTQIQNNTKWDSSLMARQITCPLTWLTWVNIWLCLANQHGNQKFWYPCTSILQEFVTKLYITKINQKSLKKLRISINQESK